MSKLKKFPVISESGNEYLVKVKKSSLFIDHYEIALYKPYIGLFGKTRFEILNDGFTDFIPSYDISRFNNSLIEAVKYVIEDYEQEQREIINSITRNDKMISEFEYWDGKC